MLRPASLFIFALALQAAPAQQVQSHGVPASVLSPTSPGVAHATPSTITSPAPRIGPNGRIVVNPRRFRVRFGDPRTRRSRHEFVPVPIFIPAYPIDGSYSYVDSDPEGAGQSAEDAYISSIPSDSEALREAYYRGARDALAQQADSRYGEHYLDGRETAQPKPSGSTSRDQESSSAKGRSADAQDAGTKNEVADNTPPTVFVFRDGHKLETRNYAILGQTLIDLSNNAMKKIPLTDLDFDATRKANDELGISLRLPSTP